MVASAEGLPMSTLEGLTVTKDLVSFNLSVKSNKIPFEMRPAEGDVMLAQKIALETAEARALSVAQTFSPRLPRARPLAPGRPF